MDKIEKKSRAYAFVHRYGGAFIRFTPITIDRAKNETFDNLLYMDIEDNDNEITIIFETASDIDNLIKRLDCIKAELRTRKIELGTGFTEKTD